MNDHKYYRDTFNYMMITDGFLQVHRLWHGVELFKDLAKIFGSKKSAECPELAEEHALYLRIPGNYEIDSGAIVPMQMIKKNTGPQYILHQRDDFIFLDDKIESMRLQIAYPARSSGYIECSLNLKTGESVSLPLFSEKMFLSKDANYFFHASEQVKNFADFLRVPWKLEAFNDA